MLLTRFFPQVTNGEVSGVVASASDCLSVVARKGSSVRDSYSIV